MNALHWTRLKLDGSFTTDSAQRENIRYVLIGSVTDDGRDAELLVELVEENSELRRLGSLRAPRAECREFAERLHCADSLAWRYLWERARTDRAHAERAVYEAEDRMKVLESIRRPLNTPRFDGSQASAPILG